MNAERKVKVLTIEDEEVLRENIAAYLEDNNYEVFQAENGRIGLEVFAREKPDVILTDLRMPEVDGLDVLSTVTEQSPETPVIIVSGTGVMRDAIEALHRGAWDYIIKPIQEIDIIDHAIKRVLERSDLIKENRKYREHLEDEIVRRTKELQLRTDELELTNVLLKNEIKERQYVEKELKKSLENLNRTMKGTIHTISLICEIRDPYTGGHQQRVARLAKTIAQEMGLSDIQVEGIHIAGLLHDIGKISVPIEILSKPGHIREAEANMIRTHSEMGWEILKDIPFSYPIAQIVLQHHEKIDGSGYPSGLTGEYILLEAKIIAVADVVEAMASHRPYRASLGVDKALEEIQRGRGILYDERIVDACLKLFREKDFSFEENKAVNVS